MDCQGTVGAQWVVEVEGEVKGVGVGGWYLCRSRHSCYIGLSFEFDARCSDFEDVEFIPSRFKTRLRTEIDCLNRIAE